jgi:peptidoglycan hydrolase CwlO-like protein
MKIIKNIDYKECYCKLKQEYNKLDNQCRDMSYTIEELHQVNDDLMHQLSIKEDHITYIECELSEAHEVIKSMNNDLNDYADSEMDRQDRIYAGDFTNQSIASIASYPPVASMASVASHASAASATSHASIAYTGTIDSVTSAAPMNSPASIAFEHQINWQRALNLIFKKPSK